MKWFKKKRERKTIGKGADECVVIHKTFDVLNYTPKDYLYTVEYSDFLQNAEPYLRRIIQSMAIDDQSAKELQVDHLIDMITRRMECSVDEQFTNHMDLIYHMKGVYRGELAGARIYIEHLKSDMNTYDQEITRCMDMQKANGIVF